MIEWISFLYSIAKDAIVYRMGRRRRLTPEEKIALRQKWKPPLEEEIIKNWRDKLRQDVIIRDVARLDSYPDIDENSKGISPWFRLGLIGLYHRGILVAMNWERLIEEDGNFRIKDYKNDDGEGIKAILAGKIPFENIEEIDFDGDEYYYYPHIYCHFSIDKSPYESVYYYDERENPGGRPFYTEIADAKKVYANSKHLRKSWWRSWLPARKGA